MNYYYYCSTCEMKCTAAEDYYCHCDDVETIDTYHVSRAGQIYMKSVTLSPFSASKRFLFGYDQNKHFLTARQRKSYLKIRGLK